MSDELPIIPKQSLAKPFPLAGGYSKKLLILAFAIAGLSDLIAAFLTLAPPIVWAVDLLTAILLFIVLGWSWLLLPGLVMEAIPGWGVIPCWLMVVGAIAVRGTVRTKVQQLVLTPGSRTALPRNMPPLPASATRTS